MQYTHRERLREVKTRSACRRSILRETQLGRSPPQNEEADSERKRYEEDLQEHPHRFMYVYRDIHYLYIEREREERKTERQSEADRDTPRHADEGSFFIFIGLPVPMCVWD